MSLSFNDQIVALLPKLRNYARALTRNGDAAEDLVQDTVVRALAKQHLYQPDTDLRAWLYTMMHNIHVNGVRHRMYEGTLVSDPLVLEAIPDHRTRPDGRIELREVIAQLNRLPGNQCSLISKAPWLANEELACREGLPVGTVRSRLFRGRTALREMTGYASSSPFQ